jgi:two-component system LytT family response regulator
MNYIIVEDEFIIRESIFNFLSSNMPELSCSGQFDCLEELIFFLESHTPNMIFMDINLIDGSGFDFVHNLRLDNINIPIIFISAYPEFEMPSKMLQNTQYLVKPFKKDDFIQVVHYIIAKQAE